MKTKENERKRHAEWRLKYPKTAIFVRIKQNAKRNGIPFNLSLEDVPDIPKFCPVFPWIKLTYTVGEGKKDSSASLDRIDNAVGYVSGNVRIISWRANEMRKNGTLREFEALVKDAEFWY